MHYLATKTLLLCTLLQWGLVLSSGNETTSPHFLFMKELRKYLSTAEIVLPSTQEYRPTNEEGKLIARSIEGTNSRGKGFSTNGFVFERANRLILDLNISAEKGHDKFPEVELWVFPDKTGVQSRNEKTIRYEAIANVAALNTPRKDSGEVFWDTNEDCVQINLTQLSNKIYNKFNKSSINESHVTLTIKIQAVGTNLAIHNANRNRPSHHNLCSLLARRATNSSFIFIKNYNEIRNHLSKTRLSRSSPTIVKTPSTAGCSLVPLFVNLTAIYGSFVKGPLVLDIKDCIGTCSSSSRNNLFSHHTIAKQRLKAIRHAEYLADYTPSCVPNKFKPDIVHFGLKDKSHVIVQLSDLVASSCACR